MHTKTDTVAEPQLLASWLAKHTAPETDSWYAQRLQQQACFVLALPEALMHGGCNQQPSLQVVRDFLDAGRRIPVYHVASGGLEIWFHCNFHCWKLSVRSDKPLRGLMSYNSPVNPAYCGGLAPDWCFGSYAANQQRFTVSLRADAEVRQFFERLAAVAAR